MASVVLDTSRITDKASFHAVFAELLRFPGYYGMNWDAWKDCMIDLRSENGQVNVRLAPHETLMITITDAEQFRERLPNVFADFICCTALANRYYVHKGEQPAIALVFLHTQS